MFIAIVIIATIVIGPFVGAAIPIVAFELIERYRR
jgi:predicted membrane-bound spermidine synthase